MLEYSVKAGEGLEWGHAPHAAEWRSLVGQHGLTPDSLSQLSPALSEGSSCSLLETNIIWWQNIFFSFYLLSVQCCIPVPFTARKLSGPSLCCCGSSCEIGSVNIYRSKQLSVFSQKPDTPSPKRPKTCRLLCAFLQTVQQL